jgi:hypothetical protein
MGPSRLLCIDSQLAIAAYQGEYASLPVKGDGQLALNAKEVPERPLPNQPTQNVIK